MSNTSKDRLASYRAKSEKANCASAKDWKYWKRNIWDTPSNSRGDKGQIFSETKDQYGEYIGDAHKVIRLDHTGWYADNLQYGTLVGGVARLRCPRGTLYIPVTSCSDWDGTTHWMGDAVLVGKGANQDEHDEAAQDAARYADHLAEREAEESREYSAKDSAEQDILGAREEIHTINKKALALIKAIKTQGKFSDVVCSALNDKLQDWLGERRKAFRLIAKREENFWSVVED